MDHYASERNGPGPAGEMNLRIARPLILATLVVMAPPAQGQLLSGPGGALDALPPVVPDTLERVGGALDDTVRALPTARLTERLRAARAARIGDLLRRHGDAVELDDRREPARRGVVLLTGAKADELQRLRAAGYGTESEEIEGLGLGVTRLAVPQGRSLARALRDVRKLAPDAEASADNLYFQSGAAARAEAPIAANRSVAGRVLGLIDGGVARHPALDAPIEQQAFAHGAPRASTHGTAVASLLSGRGSVRGAAPGAPLLVADVYGDDPAGGSAFAIARALGWMASRKVPVVTLSLVGPDNPLLAGAVRLARDRGVTLVAAVGNDGPAAPLAYPASYPGVIAVTGVDGRGRPLPEAGRAAHVDFSAPGADMQAATPDGGKGPVRGTSYAAPLVAGRLFAVGSLQALRAEAGKRRLVCGDCRNKN